MTNDDTTDLDCNSAEYWSTRYRSGDNPWDLGKQTPVFEALRHSHPAFNSTADASLSLLIPGCGYGHDAIAFAQAGFDVTAIDFAEEPLEYLKQQLKNENVHLSVLQRDVFTLGWDLAGSFDRVIEYTCYCAIQPSRREEYVRVLSAITKPGGYIAGLFFPMDEVERQGPPFNVREDEIHHQFEAAGFVLQSSQTPRESHPARAGREKLMIFRKSV